MTRYRSLTCIAALILALGLLIAAAPGWAAPARSKAPANMLPTELKGVDVKDYYIGPGAKDAGMIQTVIGYVVVAREGNRAYYAAPGDRLFEKDIIYTLKGSRCRFQMNGQDVITMGENTHLGIKTTETNPQAQTKTTVFSMLKGKAMFYALRLFKYRNTSMTVETPTAVSGVRGTKWGVEVTEVADAGSKGRASLPILVADNSPDGGFRHLASWEDFSFGSGTRANYVTTILCFSGTIFTGSTSPPPPGVPPPPAISLSMGQMTTVAAGAPPSPPTVAPPDMMNRFLEDTGVPGVQVSQGSGSGPLILLGGGTLQLSPDTTPIIQNLNGDQRPTTHFGFFTGQLSSGVTSLTYADTYTSTSIQNFDSTAATAVGTGTAYMTINGTNKTMAAFQDQIGYYASSTGQTIQMSELGHNAYTEWGTWTQPITFTAMGNSYRFNAPGYYVWGDYTKTMPTSLSGTYRGNAYGTMYSPGPAIQTMTGTFQTDVNISGGTAQISNFLISVAGGGKSASIANGQGTITGNTFTINSANVSINGGSGVLTGTNQGAFFGANAQAVGGIWNVKDDGSTYRVTGVFQGTK